MSKLLPFLVVGVGASSVSVGGVFMLKKTGGEGAPQEQQNDTNGQQGKDGQGAQTTTKISSDLGFKTLADFKTQKGGKCVEQYVPGFSLPTSASSTTPTIESNFFPSDGSIQSCLVINWERKDATTTSSPNRGTGNFQGLGTLVKGTKGMVAFAAYKPHSSEEKKMSVEGGLYAVENANNTGTVKNYSESTDSTVKQLTSADFDNSFPKKGEEIKGLDTNYNKDHFGFINSQSDIDAICKTGDASPCPADPSTSKTFKASWKGTSSSDATTAKAVDKGGANVPDVMGKIFGSTWSGIFDSMKGTWASEEIKPTPSAAT